MVWPEEVVRAWGERVPGSRPGGLIPRGTWGDVPGLTSQLWRACSVALTLKEGMNGWVEAGVVGSGVCEGVDVSDHIWTHEHMCVRECVLYNAHVCESVCLYECVDND